MVENTNVPVWIANLTVDGTGNGITGCGLNLQGILYQNASGTVNHVAVRNQIPGDVLSGCEAESIYVETGTGSSSTVTVENSSVHNYTKDGIIARYAGTNVTITGNYVQGSGLLPLGYDAQNGIELGFGAKGTIKANTVIDNLYGVPLSYAASDILLFDAAEDSGIIVSGNIVGNSQTPIGIYTTSPGSTGDRVTVSGNKIFGTGTWDAIDVCTNNNTVTGNTIFNSAEAGVHLDAGCGSTGNGNAVTGNTILESACAGILVDFGTTNPAPTGTYFTVPFTVLNSSALSSSCPGVAGPMRAQATHKVSPAR